MPCAALPCPALRCAALPCAALPCPALRCAALPCAALPCPALPCPALPCAALRCPALPPETRQPLFLQPASCAALCCLGTLHAAPLYNADSPHHHHLLHPQPLSTLTHLLTVQFRPLFSPSPSQVLFNAGDPSDSGIFIVVHGSLGVFRHTEADSEPVLFNTLRCGRGCGEEGGGK
eukprot:354496-Chlamydomonas_euryale.AAC.4